MAFPFGAIVSLAGQAASGIFSAINNRRMQRERDAESARQVAEAEGRAYEDPLARSEVQASTNKYDRDAEKQVETARNVAAITGATPEYNLGVQKAVAEGKANLLGRVTESASERKDKYLDEAEKARRAHAAQVRSDREARNSTYAALAANAANAFGSIVDSYTTDAAAKKNETATVPQGQGGVVETSPVTSGGEAKIKTTVAPNHHEYTDQRGLVELPGKITTQFAPTPVTADTSGKLKLRKGSLVFG